MPVFKPDDRSGPGTTDNAKQWNPKHQESFCSVFVCLSSSAIDGFVP